ncbi:MAG: tetratricopeptide repeat protein, partial [Acidobacteriota bacterium]
FGVYQRLQAESQRAVATEQFLLELFASADPDGGHGGELTVREVLDEGVRRIDRLHGQPLLQGHLMNMVGHIYANLGRPQEAEDLARQALDLHLERAGERSKEGADSHRLLGRLLSEGGAFAEADRHLRRAIELYEEAFPAPKPRAEALTTLAYNHHQQGESNRALETVREAIDLCRREKLEDSSEMAVAVNNLGFILHGQGETEGAIAAFEEALDLNARLHGVDHPMVALAHSNLGAIAIVNDRPAEAMQRLEAALDIWRRTVGEDDRLALSARFNIASLHFRAARYGQTVEAVELLLPRITGALGADHPLEIDALELLAKALDGSGRDPARALELRRRVLDRCRELYGDEHPKTANALYQLALDRRRAAPARSITWLRQAIEIERRHYGPDDERTRATERLLTELLAVNGREVPADAAAKSPDAASGAPPPNPGAR